MSSTRSDTDDYVVVLTDDASTTSSYDMCSTAAATECGDDSDSEEFVPTVQSPEPTVQPVTQATETTDPADTDATVVSHDVMDKLADMLADKLTDMLAEKLADKIPNMIIDKVSDEVAQKASVKIAEKAAAQIAERAAVQIAEKAAAQTPKKTPVKISKMAPVEPIDEATAKMAKEASVIIIKKTPEHADKHTTRFVDKVPAEFTQKAPVKPASDKSAVPQELIDMGPGFTVALQELMCTAGVLCAGSKSTDGTEDHKNLSVMWRKCRDYWTGIQEELEKEGIWVPHDQIAGKALPAASVNIMQKFRMRLMAVHHKDPVKDAKILPNLMDDLLTDLEIAVDRICGPRERPSVRVDGYAFY